MSRERVKIQNGNLSLVAFLFLRSKFLIAVAVGSTGRDFLSDVHFADLVYFGSTHSTYCACANAMCFLPVFGGNYSICLS